VGASDTRERALADSQFGSGTPATWYLALSTTTPNGDGTGFTEPVGGSYARVAITNNATNFPPASTADGVTAKRNGTKFTFVPPTGTWGIISYYGFYLTSSGGTPEYTFPLDTAITVKSGNTPVEFDVSLLQMFFAGV
jgi:hypothetical protein